MSTLKVFATPGAMVPDYAAMGAGVLRFVGRRHDPGAGVNGGFVVSPEAVEIPYQAEYIQELRSGGLLPADQATADAAGTPFKAKAK